MLIYRAKDGDTVASIARKHGILPNRLCELNGIEADMPPIPGQAFVIDCPVKSYYVKAGDTLRSIAAHHRIPLSALMRQNPALAGGEEIYPGMTLTLTNAECPRGAISVLGYARADTAPRELMASLPYLTYLAVVGALLDENGYLIPTEDAEAVTTARRAGVVPLLTVTPKIGVLEDRLLQSIPTEEGRDALTERIAAYVRERGYGGVLLEMPFACPTMHEAHNALVARLRRRLGHGMAVLSTISPLAMPKEPRTLATLGRAANGLVISAYDFATRYGSPAPEAPYDRVKETLSGVLGCVRPQKLLLGLSARAEDFPVGGGEGRVYAASDVVALAGEHGGRIAYDPIGRVPYLSYRTDEGERIVFFEDAESFCEKLSLAAEGGIGGVALFPAVGLAQPLLSVLSLMYSVVKPYGG